MGDDSYWRQVPAAFPVTAALPVAATPFAYPFPVPTPTPYPFPVPTPFPYPHYYHHWCWGLGCLWHHRPHWWW
ncbi:MAG: hypothetical protein P4N41_09460 [Negativicutes bacterium]|nr:hypothetical protein [Negativicutes bacterium]